MIGERFEILRPDGDESYELRCDGRCIARIDRLLMEALQHWAKEGREIGWLELVAIPETRTAPK